MKSKGILLLLVLCTVLTSANAQKYISKSNTEVKTTWEGVEFSSNKTLSENINGIAKFSYLNGIFDDASRTTMLANEEMVTVFAMLDSSFTGLSEEARENLLNDNAGLTSMIKFLSVPGRLDLTSIKNSIRKNDGYAFFATLAGGRLGAKYIEGEVVLFDSENNTAKLMATDFYHKNGLFHVVDGLVFPPSK